MYLVSIISISFENVFRVQPTTVCYRMGKNLAVRTKNRQPFVLNLNRERITFPLHRDLIK